MITLCGVVSLAHPAASGVLAPLVLGALYWQRRVVRRLNHPQLLSMQKERPVSSPAVADPTVDVDGLVISQVDINAQRLTVVFTGGVGFVRLHNDEGDGHVALSRPPVDEDDRPTLRLWVNFNELTPGADTMHRRVAQHLRTWCEHGDLLRLIGNTGKMPVIMRDDDDWVPLVAPALEIERVD